MCITFKSKYKFLLLNHLHIVWTIRLRQLECSTATSSSSRPQSFTYQMDMKKTVVFFLRLSICFSLLFYFIFSIALFFIDDILLIVLYYVACLSRWIWRMHLKLPYCLERGVFGSSWKELLEVRAMELWSFCKWICFYWDLSGIDRHAVIDVYRHQSSFHID